MRAITSIIVLMSCTVPGMASKPAETGTVAIADQAALDVALANAKGGEHFTLADGEYALRLENRRYPATVTIQGSRAARFAPFATLTNVANLTIRGVTFTAGAGRSEGMFAIRPTASENIVFDGVGIIGSDRTSAGIFAKTPDNRNIIVRNSEIARLQTGIRLYGGETILIEKNDFHDLRSDGIQLGGTRNVTIQDNVFRDFAPARGDHPDVTQLVGPCTNTVFQRNVLRGSAQGITSHNNAVFQDGVYIYDNDIRLRYAHAIRIMNGRGEYANNKVSGDITLGGDFTKARNAR